MRRWRWDTKIRHQGEHCRSRQAAFCSFRYHYVAHDPTRPDHRIVSVLSMFNILVFSVFLSPKTNFSTLRSSAFGELHRNKSHSVTFGDYTGLLWSVKSYMYGWRGIRLLWWSSKVYFMTWEAHNRRKKPPNWNWTFIFYQRKYFGENKYNSVLNKSLKTRANIVSILESWFFKELEYR